MLYSVIGRSSSLLIRRCLTPLALAISTLKVAFTIQASFTVTKWGWVAVFGNAAFFMERFGVSIDNSLIYQWSMEELGCVRDLPSFNGLIIRKSKIIHRFFKYCFRSIISNFKVLYSFIIFNGIYIPN